MTNLTIAYLAVLTFFTSTVSFAQDSLITELAKNNVTTFLKAQNTFIGPGWKIITQQAKKCDNVLIGEDHFTNEIPDFVAALSVEIKFDNFITEIDPYSAKILETEITNLSTQDFNKYRNDFGNTFGFFALQPEFNLLQQLVKSNTKLFGTDQISSVADRLICSKLQKITKNFEAKRIYAIIEDSSKIYFKNFVEGKSNPHGIPFYMFTNEFQKNLTALSAIELSKEEMLIIDRMKLSAKIYQEQNHQLRIQLMKNELMKVYSQWEEKKNLFKYGAIHVSKGESFFKIFDIGNVVHNVSDSKFKNSLHIMVVGKSGSQGSPFKDFPERQIDENSEILKSFKPLFKAVQDKDWHCIDMLPLRKAVENEKLVVKDITLLRIINGYDLIVVIPTVTAAKF